MKRVLIAAIALASFTQVANAQAGSILLYGDLNVSTGKTAGESSYSSLSINPGVGYQFNDNWTAGLQFGIGSTSDEIGTTGNKDKTSEFNVGPFIRYTKKLGDIEYQVLSPANYLCEDINEEDQDTRDERIHEQCGEIKLTYGKEAKSILITGDADKAAGKDHITEQHKKNLPA